MRFRTKLAVFLAKTCNKIIKMSGKGNGLTLPGKVALMVDKNVLSEMASQVSEKIIVTMGTNGKTTTNSILFSAIEGSGKKAIINRTGSNMMNGIVSAFVLAAGKNCKIDAQIACVEVDENSSVHVLPHLKPDAIILTNISRDQLDRFGEVDITYSTVLKAISSVPDATLVVNCDDVISYSLAQNAPNRHITFGISEQIFDNNSKSEIKESIFCRKCGKKMEYEFFHYGQLGIYHCDNCGFKRPMPEYSAYDVSEVDGVYSFTIDGIRINSQARTPYNTYNTLAAYVGMKAIGVNTDNFKASIESFDYGNNREGIFSIYETRAQLHLSKNPIGFQQKVSLVLRDKNPKDIIVLINDGFQDGTDVSWLWDVDFQIFADANATGIYTAGSRRYDMALRLSYEDITCHVTTDLEKTVREVCKNGTKNLYIIVNYTALYSTYGLLESLAKESSESGEKFETVKGFIAPETEKIEPIVDIDENVAGKELTIGHLYPDLLNLYGDRGNIQCLRKRMERRGIKANVVPYESGDKIDFENTDIFLLGGGSDREQELVCAYLTEIKDDFINYVENGGTVIAVCGGYQLLGKYYKTPDKKIDGIGVMDYYTEWEKGRLVNNIVLQSDRYNMPIVGFENHGGRTYQESCETFGKVIYGYGNTKDSGAEGAVYKNVIATYLHGPLLPKNPEVCDDLITRAFNNRYKTNITLKELKDDGARLANELLVKRFTKK